ncbi:MAG: hypothetical protein NTX64_14270, partial [Elusimicrobia bacterium]|nr:hypothetical protein [Elusimicrobiota bacterium]
MRTSRFWACLALLAALPGAGARAQTSQLSDLEFDATGPRYIYVDSPTAGAGVPLNIIGGPANGSNAGGNLVISGGASAYNSGNVLLNPTTGYVGIRTAVPVQPLDVAGNVGYSKALMPNNIAGTTGQFLLSQGKNVAPVWTNTFSTGVAIGGTGSLTLSGSSVTLTGAAALIGQSIPITSTGITTTGGIQAAFFTGDGSGLTISTDAPPVIPPQAIDQNPMIFIGSVTLTTPAGCVSVSWPQPYIAYTFRFYAPSESAVDVPCMMFGYGNPAVFDPVTYTGQSDGPGNEMGDPGDYGWSASQLFGGHTDSQLVQCAQLVGVKTTYKQELFELIDVIFNFAGSYKPYTSVGIGPNAPPATGNVVATFSGGQWIGPGGDISKLITGVRICNYNPVNTFAVGTVLSA